MLAVSCGDVVMLLFGAGGQLGRELADAASRAGEPLFGLRRDQADITNKQAVARAIETIGPGLVVNAAAYTSVDQAEDDPEAAFSVNVTGASILAEVCADADIPLIHISTDYVFDGNKSGAYREDDAVAPLGVYGRSKADGEMAIRQLGAKHIILRTAWLFGGYGTNFLKTILRLAVERDELHIVADQRGSPTSTTDLAHAILSIRHHLGTVQWGTYHFAGRGEATWHEFARRIVEAQASFTGKRPLVRPIASTDFSAKARRPQNSVLDSSRFAGVFGFRAGIWEQNVDRKVAELFNRVQPFWPYYGSC